MENLTARRVKSAPAQTELLTVVATIALLAASSSRVFGQALENAPQTPTPIPSVDVPAAKRDVVPLEMGKGGRLIYRPYTPQGDTILDFSHAGYGGGGVALPDVPAKITLAPDDKSQNDTPRLQEALDALAKLPLDAKGFRGALLLKRGTFRLNDTLKINASGIVIRGEGNDEKGTVLFGNVRKVYSLISVAGGPIVPLPATTQKITDAYVPVNGRVVSVVNASGFKVGDTVSVTRNGNQAWIHEIGMDRIPARANTRQWGPFILVFDRVVTKVEGNTLTLDAPLSNSIDQKWGGGSVAKYDGSARLSNVGVENLFGSCDFDRSITTKIKDTIHLTDVNHVLGLVNFSNVTNMWARDLGTRYLESVVVVSHGTKHSTVQDSYSVEPVSRIEGGRRYPFLIGKGQLGLWQRLRTQGARHSYAVALRVTGPNVFLDCVGTDEHTNSEPHHKWSVGGLYDNVKGKVAVFNRGRMGSGHGWAGANYVVWNGEGSLLLQSPPTAENFAFGHVGTIGKPPFGETNGWIVSEGKHVEPRSLYLQQLAERLGPQAVKNIAPKKVKEPTNNE